MTRAAGCTDCGEGLRDCPTCGGLICGCRPHESDLRYVHWTPAGERRQRSVADERRRRASEVSTGCWSCGGHLLSSDHLHECSVGRDELSRRGGGQYQIRIGPWDSSAPRPWARGPRKKGAAPCKTLTVGVAIGEIADAAQGSGARRDRWDRAAARNMQSGGAPDRKERP